MTDKVERLNFMWLWVFPVAIFVASMFILVGVQIKADREALISANPTQATALVLAIDRSTAGHNRLTGEPSYRYAPRIQITLQDGTVYRGELDSEPHADEYFVGQHVDVTYSATDPEQVVATARRYDFEFTRIWGWVLFGTGAVCLVLADWFTRWFRRALRPKRPRAK